MTAINTNNLIFNSMPTEDKLQSIYEKISDVKEDVSELKTDMKSINEKILHPDEGLYSRIKNIEHKVEHHSKLHDRLVKISWFVLTTTIGVIIKLIVG